MCLRNGSYSVYLGIRAPGTDERNGIYVLAVISSAKEDGDVISEQFRLNNMYQSRAYYEAYEALKTNANIVDKRYNFY